ncbi:replication-associated recombination protein A [Mycoplasma zalophidermidis]|uniref:Replication-associated recombination protein A n=1 Tax=Mycoplasma zalophidermidis TaxID=398174 RepID=A0ABS6DRX2_9MOLU|nr:replication-associated recombination protein A [Mycoplasma zalophidermidis]MBU4693762.1 replication-associated recombination protein A [Mycoplasma zalophidermidis]
MNNLANKLRPKTLNDIVGQKNIVNLLKKVVESHLHTSYIFFGESGVGKTSTAIALANDLGLKYGLFNASVDNKNELITMINNNDIVIIDEIHRLTKNLQDILLSYLEFDKVIIYATTTENPYFRVNPALRSRMQILQFKKLDEHDIFEALKVVIKQNYPKLNISDDNILCLIKHSTGDYRFCLNNLQMLATLSNGQEISEDIIKTLIPNINFYVDKDSSAHYDYLSAFHKSLRGSDVDAALYWGAIILKSGDYQGLFRRLTAVAYEDIGLADPNASLRVEAALNAVERLGFPEANIPIFYLITQLALSPKSSSTYKAMNKMLDFIEAGNIFEVPKHLKDSHFSSASKLGYGINYKYPHDYPNSWVNQTYLPKKIENMKFFTPSKNDNKKITDYCNLIANWKDKKDEN